MLQKEYEEVREQKVNYSKKIHSILDSTYKWKFFNLKEIDSYLEQLCTIIEKKPYRMVRVTFKDSIVIKKCLVNIKNDSSNSITLKNKDEYEEWKKELDSKLNLDEDPYFDEYGRISPDINGYSLLPISIESGYEYKKDLEKNLYLNSFIEKLITLRLEKNNPQLTPDDYENVMNEVIQEYIPGVKRNLK